MLKIWLPYALALSLSLLAALLFDLFPDRWAAGAAGLSLCSIFQEKYIQAFGGHFWFVGAIMALYAVFPLLKRVQQRLRNEYLFAAGAFVLSVGWWVVVYVLDKSGQRSWNSFFLQFLWEFALGMALAEVYRRGRWPEWLKGQYLWLALLAAALFFFGIMAWMVLKMGAAGKIFNDVPAFLGYTALSILVFLLAQKRALWLRRALQWLGEFSYALYLVHVLVLEIVLRLTGPLQAWNTALFAACGISGSSSVRATRIAKLARRAFEMNHLWPLMTHSSPSL